MIEKYNLTLKETVRPRQGGWLFSSMQPPSTDLGWLFRLNRNFEYSSETYPLSFKPWLFSPMRPPASDLGFLFKVNRNYEQPPAEFSIPRKWTFETPVVIPVDPLPWLRLIRNYEPGPPEIYPLSLKPWIFSPMRPPASDLGFLFRLNRNFEALPAEFSRPLIWIPDLNRIGIPEGDQLNLLDLPLSGYGYNFVTDTVILSDGAQVVFTGGTVVPYHYISKGLNRLAN